jgi:PKD repeat protein
MMKVTIISFKQHCFKIAKRQINLFEVKLLLFMTIIVGSSTSLKAQINPLKVLFIGNSITYFNDMPQLFESMAEDQGHEVEVSMYAPGGTGFVHHYIDPNVHTLLSSTVWDIVVLQPGSGESAGASYPVSTTIQRGQIILDSIYANSPCAKVYLYQIPYGVVSPSDYANYFSVQDLIIDNLHEMADALELQLIPAGASARSYYGTYENIYLHNTYNDIHPSLAGSFLTAATAYSSIFQDSITDCNFTSTIPQDSAQNLFAIAENTVMNHFPEWNINTYNLHASFTENINGNVVQFTNSSTGYTSSLWEFGDGTNDLINSPQHTYTSNGTYEIQLTVVDANGCSDSTSSIIQLSSLGLSEDVKNNTVIVYPNPASDYIQLASDQAIDFITLYDNNGKTFYSTTETSFSIKELPAGNYYLEISINGNKTLQPFIKQE